jgi:hypothetical protein
MSFKRIPPLWGKAPAKPEGDPFFAPIGQEIARLEKNHGLCLKKRKGIDRNGKLL